MAAAVSHGQLPLGQLPSYKKHTLGKKRVPLCKKVSLNRTVQVQSQAGFGRDTVKIKEEENPIEVESEPAGGTKKFVNLPGTIKLQGSGQSQAKSNKVVFVAGATGKVGSRTVRELLKLGFQVRASTRRVEKAETLFEDVIQCSLVDTQSNDAGPFGIFSPEKLFGFLKPKLGKSLEIVECDLEDAESIEAALGNAGVVICCIGASEREVLDVTGPYRIDFKATQNLIEAACSAEINHFVLVTSLGTQKFGFPAAVLNLFWGVLVWKAKAEKALLQSGLSYTIVRPGGMERPTDAYKETHNLILAEADKLFGGQVSNLQVAELLASIVENPDVSLNKIIEAVAETTAPLRPIKELLGEIPANDTKIIIPEPQSIKKVRAGKADVAAKIASKKQEEEKLAEEKRAQVLKEKEEKRIQAEKSEKEKLKAEALRKKYEEEIQAAKEREKAAKTAAETALADKAELEKKVAEIRAKAEAAALAASQAKAVEAAVLAAAQKGNTLSDVEKERIMESVKLERLPKADSLKDTKVSSKKKPAFSFLGRETPPSTATETPTNIESVNEAKEEKEKADAEVKAKTKAKVDEEATAKLAEKKQLEEKAKKEVQTKKKEEQDRLEKEAKALAEAKKKEEQYTLEQEAKALAGAKEKEEQDRLQKEAKALAEAKKKEEQDRLEKEAKALAEQEAERAAEAKRKEKEIREAKRKEEQEAEKLKLETEEKVKALAEQEAAAAAAAKVEEEKLAEEKAKQKEEKIEAAAPAPRKGFRWFWQAAEPDTAAVEPITEAVNTGVTDVPVEAEAMKLPPSSTPLSPYARYPGLKPPSPPIPSPPEAITPPKVDLVSSEINSTEQCKDVDLPAEKEDTVVAEQSSKELQEEIEARKRRVQETAAREKEALEKAKAANSFMWPWQKPKPVEESSISAAKEEGSLSQSTVLQQEKAGATLPPSSRPLSPYTQFPNLKPPSPPTASPVVLKCNVEEPKAKETLESSSSPLSPYPGFPDLKPPTSPAPLPEKDTKNGAVPDCTAGVDEKFSESVVSSGFKWPWQ